MSGCVDGCVWLTQVATAVTLKEPASDGFDEWFKLACEAGLVNNSLEQDGVQYVISSGGTVVPYEELAAIFTLEKLRSLVEMKQQ